MEMKKRNLQETQKGALQGLPESLPGPGEFCQDAEGNMYQVIGRACHSKTGEEMVVYQALYGDYRWYACPAPEFCLERKAFVASVSIASSAASTSTATSAASTSAASSAASTSAASSAASTSAASSASATSSALLESTILDSSKEAEQKEEESQIRKELLLFLDAEDAGEKLAVLRTIRKKLDESLLTSIELSLDLIPDERESQERRLELIERTLEKRVKYEGSRLRAR